MFKEKTTTLETLPNIITTQTPHKVYYKVMEGKKAVGVFLNYQDFQNLLENLKKQSIPTYYLKGKKTQHLDELVKEGIKEYKAGKTKCISSLADLR